MRKSNLILMTALLAVLTVLLTYDYFPSLVQHFTIPKPLLLSLIVAILFANIIINRNKKDNRKELIIYQSVSIVYSLLLLLTFTSLGGESQFGISLDNPFFWIVVAVGLFELYRTHRKYVTDRYGD